MGLRSAYLTSPSTRYDTSPRSRPLSRIPWPSSRVLPGSDRGGPRRHGARVQGLGAGRGKPRRAGRDARSCSSLFRRLCDRRTGLVAAVLFSIQPMGITLSTWAYTDGALHRLCGRVLCSPPIRRGLARSPASSACLRCLTRITGVAGGGSCRGRRRDGPLASSETTSRRWSSAASSPAPQSPELRPLGGDRAPSAPTTSPQAVDGGLKTHSNMAATWEFCRRGLAATVAVGCGDGRSRSSPSLALALLAAVGRRVPAAGPVRLVASMAFGLAIAPQQGSVRRRPC